jgi:hypothetical protein
VLVMNLPFTVRPVGPGATTSLQEGRR